MKVTEFNQAQHWSEHAESGQRKMEVAQKELMRLMPELFESVVFLYVPEPDEAA
jgi:hypothetical protein